ncbi:hypothetical protein WR25_23944 [Diploscapter pachys]|uniref:SNTX MACPF/CDC-like domain-containing protein n=1 Tax=Diploscapter pachys TaxID=2018661 RepID=A0A2A2J9S4_9BILA|nr:hypothetical protein WR25_23944 [Diploscapter pachys]
MTIHRQALGRIAQLGELYDAHTDTFCGNGIFNDKLPEEEKDMIDNGHNDLKYIYNDAMKEKLDKLHIEGELKASFLSGAIQVGGSGKYLDSTSKSARESSATLICKITTKSESINISHCNVTSLLSSDSVTNMPNATHFVSGIRWGAIAIATVKCTREESDDKKEIEAALKAKIAKIKIGGSGHGEYKKDAHDKSRQFQFELLIDALPNGDDVPQDFEQAIEFMKKLPVYVANANGGKGVPIHYTLMPLSAIKTCLGNIESLDRIVNSIDEDAINKAIRIFDEMNESIRPNPPKWRFGASVAYFKDKLYYLGGGSTNRVDLLMVMKIERYIDYQRMNRNGLKLESFQKYEFLSELHR